MPHGSGRKSCLKWAKVLDSENKNRVLCKYCKQEISRKIERIRCHLKKCTKAVSTSQKTSIVLSDEDSMTSSRSNGSGDKDKNKGSESSRNKKRIRVERENSANTLKNRNLDEFVVKTTPEQKNNLDKAVAKFFFGNNIPFNVVENPTFKEMVSTLRPGYIAPNRKQLAERFLPEISSEIENNLKQELKDSSITLILDGWSNSSNDSVIASSIHTGFGVYLVNAEETGAKKKTSEYCVEVANKAIDQIKALYNKDVFACCTDNENKMKKMKQILTGTRGILTYGCSAHYINLLYKDLIPTNVTKHIVEIQKFFRKHHQPHGWLKEKQGKMPQIPNETRWNSYEDCLKTFISNYHLYTQIRSEHLEDFRSYPNINTILNNVSLYSKAINLEKQLSVLANTLYKIQGDGCLLADAVASWNNLTTNEFLVDHLESIKKRLTEALSPIHYVAYLMHPKYLGQPLSEFQENMAEEWINENYPDFLPYFLAFRIKDLEYFPQSLFKPAVVEKFSAIKWWKILMAKNETSKKLPDSFCQFMSNLQCCPASAASIERVFSSYGLIWNELRNRLGFERALQLVKVYKCLRSESNEW